jgi:hypothetical protein
MKNNNISREQAQFEFDELLEAQKNGQNVTHQQIKACDDEFTRVARLENIASLNHRLYDVGAEFETLAACRVKARDAIRACLHKKDAITELIKKIEIYVEGVDLKLNIAAAEESEVLELLEQS